jgi:hypothetical protein
MGNFEPNIDQKGNPYCYFQKAVPPCFAPALRLATLASTPGQNKARFKTPAILKSPHILCGPRGYVRILFPRFIMPVATEKHSSLHQLPLGAISDVAIPSAK